MLERKLEAVNPHVGSGTAVRTATLTEGCKEKPDLQDEMLCVA
jgi:hypothetical protein